ncbi:MAG: hypothetical protein O7E52_25510 [Candidatus Poribacteria bacterium]|nr:hypothetical protein [Candidatus Poribacteria bacterium]
MMRTTGGRCYQGTVTWGNPDYKYQSASLAKAFSWALVGLAVDDGRHFQEVRCEPCCTS